MTDDELAELARLMVWGLDTPDEIDGVVVPADYPLDVKQAARWMGVRVKRARVALSDLRFKREYAQACEALRNGQRARNLVTAIAIRDNPGEDSAADRTVRLRAIQTIEGRDGGTTVNVNLDQSQTNIAIPGYVIKLQAPSSFDAGSLPPPGAPALIDASPLPALQPATLTEDNSK